MNKTLVTAIVALAAFTRATPTVCAQETLVYEGDLNDDGSHDITDAIYLLQWLFLGGPPPPELPPANLAERLAEQEALIAELEATRESLQSANEELTRQVEDLLQQIEELEQQTDPPTPSGPSPLPDTGQAICYDDLGNVTDCSGQTCPGQDAFYAAACSMEERFVDNNDGTVTDNCTGLMWQKATGNARRPLNWCSALDYCEDLQLAGHGDWRLPNVRELQSLVDYGRRNPSISPAFDAEPTIYWTSTTANVSPDAAWDVGFLDGELGGVFKAGGALVRAVRTAQ